MRVLHESAIDFDSSIVAKSHGYINYNFSFDNDNKITESGKMFSEMVKKYKTNSILPVKRTSAIVFRDSDIPKPEIVDWNTGLKFADATWKNAERFCDCIRNGIHPAIILPDKVGDKEYLKMRGIENILD